MNHTDNGVTDRSAEEVSRPPHAHDRGSYCVRAKVPTTDPQFGRTLIGSHHSNNNTIEHRVNHIDITDHLTLKSFHPCSAPHQMFSLSPCQ
ncbi:unnamed protein product [Boreogadus saida]